MERNHIVLAVICPWWCTVKWPLAHLILSLHRSQWDILIIFCKSSLWAKVFSVLYIPGSRVFSFFHQRRTNKKPLKIFVALWSSPKTGCLTLSLAAPELFLLLCRINPAPWLLLLFSPILHTQLVEHNSGAVTPTSLFHFISTWPTFFWPKNEETLHAYYTLSPFHSFS